MKFIKLEEFFRESELRRKGLLTWIDKLKFSSILLIWIIIIVIFGLTYHYFSSNLSYLLLTREGINVSRIADSVYFSFVAATTTGFGDMVPVGFFKVLSIFEVVLGLLLLALVTSKLVSIKQDMILNELYELSINEKINRLRSSLLLFRQNISRVINKVEEGTIKKREVSELYMYISSLEDILNEISSLLGKSKDHHFKKGIDAVNTELIIISILNSFEKILEMIESLNENKIDWQRDITIRLIQNSINRANLIFERVKLSKNLIEKTLSDIGKQKDDVISKLQKFLEVKSKES